MHRLVAACMATAVVLTMACGGTSSSGNSTPAAATDAPATTAARTAAPGSATAPSPAATAQTPSGATATPAVATPTLASGEATAAAPPPTATPTPVPPPPPPPPPPAGGGTIRISAQDSLFDQTSLTGVAGPITVIFSNKDTIAHNIHVYNSDSSTLASSDLETGPVEQALALGTMKPGAYRFACDVHPQTMRGVLTIS